MVTYGDGLADIDFDKQINYFNKIKKKNLVTICKIRSQYGHVKTSFNSGVLEFKEKPQIGEGWIHGGFFIFESDIFKYLNGDETVLEAEPLERLALDGQLMAFKHVGFWQCMDTLRDKIYLNKIFTIMLVVLFSGNVNSHSGRTNQEGCHVDDSFTLTVDYHCHEKKHSNNLNIYRSSGSYRKRSSTRICKKHIYSEKIKKCKNTLR